MGEWTYTREWPGETAWIIGGGPSLRGVDLSPLRERRTIGVNSVIFSAPWVDFLVFGDSRWYRRYKHQLPVMRGRLVTNSPSVTNESGVLSMKKVRASDVGISEDPSTLAMLWTSTAAAMNLAVHLGVKRIVLLGVDLKPTLDGTMYHHTPHPKEWGHKTNWPNMQIESFGYCVKPLHRLGIEVVNANPDSALPYWPKRPLEELL